MDPSTLADCLDKFSSCIKKDDSNFKDILDDIGKILFTDEKLYQIDDKVLNQMFLVKDLEMAQAKYDRLRFSANCTLDLIKVQCQDVHGKDHSLTIKFVSHRLYQIQQHTLPDMKILTENFTDLLRAVDTFQTCLDDIEEYLEVMDDLDTNCWVIDPKIATSKDNYRRIVIVEDVSAMITVDVQCSKKPPSIKLLGPSKLTDPLMEKIHENIIEWDVDGSYIPNLLALFAMVQFPLKDDMAESDGNDPGLSNSECSICLIDRDDTDGQLPSIMCACKLNYHKSCLYQWLTMTANVIQGLNTVHGQCPSCHVSISCPTMP